MTTTAEKIKVMQAFDEWKKRGFDQPTIIEKTPKANNSWEDVGYEPQWNWEAFEYRIKPADHEPLECWGNFYFDEDRPTNPHCVVHMTAEKALIARLKGGKTIHMREVRPQDEQDRKDAARYRWLKQNAETGGLCFDGWDNIAARDKHKWNEMIDKAMKEQ